MKDNQTTFYQWLKIKTTVQTPSQLDKKIATLAKEKLTPPKGTLSQKWIKILLPIGVTVLIVFMIQGKMNQQKKLTNVILTDSPEMILNYKSIELMADMGELSDEDWKKIEGVSER